jgi:hypothetical protein
MKPQTKIIIAISIAIMSCILLIGKLFDKKADNTLETQIDTQITSETTSTSINTTKATKTTKKTTKTTKRITTQKVNQSSGGYKLTHYGYDCCKTGKTATGYDISKTIYYNDATYGNVRIVAMCSKMPLYSIIKIKNYKIGGDTLAIVLDRGVGCSIIDLAVKNEKQASQYGIQNNVQIEILRKGK